MTTEVLSQTLAAGVSGYFGQGRIWYLKTATSAVTINCRKSGQGSQNVRKFVNVAAGFKFSADPGDGWDSLEINSALSQNIEIIIGDDDVEVANAVTVSGSVVVQPQATTTTLDTAAVVRATATQGALIAANASRRKALISADSANAGSCYVRTVGGANNLAELQPGTGFIHDGINALEVRNDTGANATFYIMDNQ